MYSENLKHDADFSGDCANGPHLALIDFLNRAARLSLANCYRRADSTGNRAAQVNWLSLSERVRSQ